MTGGKATPKKDKSIKVCAGQQVKTGQILVRGIDSYKAGNNAQGLSTIHALCEGNVYFTKKKTSHGKVRTFINITPLETKPSK
jgi:ribosomal protein L27